LFHRARLLAFREAKAVGRAVAATQVWDNRWHCPDAPADCEIRALGADGLAQAKLWRSLGLPRAALLSQPSLWRDGRLLAAPILAGLLENGENRQMLKAGGCNPVRRLRLSVP
jgi:tRNA(Ile)-lysidine synthase